MSDETVMNPGSSEQEDMYHLLNIFPSELWVKILEKIEDPTDQENCSNASLALRNFLAPSRQLFLFQKVFDVMETHVYRKTDKKSISYLNSFPNPIGVCRPGNSDEPPVDNGVRKVLKLRQVSKTWKNGCDQVYQTKSLAGCTTEVAYGDLMELTLNTADFYSRNGDQVLTNFMAKFGDTASLTKKTDQDYCPILSRSVAVSFSHPHRHDGQEVHAVLLQIFQKYGSSINKFTITYDNNSYMYEHYNSLRQYLSLMKNLKFLDVSVRNWITPTFEKADRKLRKDLRETPILKMEQLEKLSLHDLPVPLFEHLVQINNNVTNLTVFRQQLFLNYDFSILTLPNLKHLVLPCLSQIELEALGRSSCGEALEKLEMSLGPIGTLGTIFALLGNKWGNTLMDACFHITEANTEEDNEQQKTDCMTLQKQYLPQVSEMKIIAKVVRRSRPKRKATDILAFLTHYLH